MSTKKPTVEELKAAMKAAGMDESAWGDMGGGGPKQPEFMLRQANNLKTLSGLLEQAVASKQGEIRTLDEKLQRLLHGGGS